MFSQCRTRIALHLLKCPKVSQKRPCRTLLGGLSHLKLAMRISENRFALQGVSQLQCRESRYTATLRSQLWHDMNLPLLCMLICVLLPLTSGVESRKHGHRCFRSATTATQIGPIRMVAEPHHKGLLGYLFSAILLTLVQSRCRHPQAETLLSQEGRRTTSIDALKSGNSGRLWLSEIPCWRSFPARSFGHCYELIRGPVVASKTHGSAERSTSRVNSVAGEELTRGPAKHGWKKARVYRTAC